MWRNIAIWFPGKRLFHKLLIKSLKNYVRQPQKGNEKTLQVKNRLKMKTAWASSVWRERDGQQVSDPPTWMEVTASWWALTDWQFWKVSQLQAWTFPPSAGWQSVRLIRADRRLAVIIVGYGWPTWAWLPKLYASITVIQLDNSELLSLTHWQMMPHCQTLHAY